MGDFNIDLIKYQQHVFTTESLDNMFSHFLLPLINRPTRITSHTASLFDNIITNNTTSESSSGILITDISDDLPIYTVPFGQELSNNNNQAYKLRKRNINAVTNERFQNEPAKCNWEDVYCVILHNSFPYITISRRRAKLYIKPWITKGLLKSINIKCKLYKAYLKNPCDFNNDRYKKYKNKLNHLFKNF